MTKDVFTDGVCDTCGNTGLAGEKCLMCGDTMTKINTATDDPILNPDNDMPPNKEEPEVYPLEVLDKEMEDNPSVLEE